MMISNPSSSHAQQDVYFHHLAKDSLRHNELVSCPRCKVRLVPNCISGTNEKEQKTWWLCPNAETCMFPLDMPQEIYTVTRTARMIRENYYPPPEIEMLPKKYRYMYPISFPPQAVVSSGFYPTRAQSQSIKGSGSKSSLPISRCSSSSDGDKDGAIKTREAGSQQSEGDVSSTTADGEEDDDDFEMHIPAPRTSRILKTKRNMDSTKNLCQRIMDQISANQGQTMESLLKMDDEKLSEIIEKSLEVLNSNLDYRVIFPTIRTRTRFTSRVDLIEQECRLDIGKWKINDSAQQDVRRAPPDIMFKMKEAKTADQLIEAVGLKKMPATGASTTHAVRRLQKRKDIIDQRIQGILAKLMCEKREKRVVKPPGESQRKKIVQESRKRKAQMSVEDRIKKKLEEVKQATESMGPSIGVYQQPQYPNVLSMPTQYENVNYDDFSHGHLPNQYNEEEINYHQDFSSYPQEDTATGTHAYHNDYSLNLTGLMHEDEQHNFEQQPSAEQIHLDTAAMDNDEFSSMFDL